MRLSINLASRPFVELRPVFLRLRLLAAALLLLALGLGVLLHRASDRARAAHAQLDALAAQTASTRREYQGYQAAMRQPQNAQVLARAQFLNALFARKAFSWTAVMMDLENVLPAGVQVVSIEPALTPDGHVSMKLRVTGRREKTVDLVRNLERSHRFTSARLVGESAESQTPGQFQPQNTAGPGDVAFDIVADYVPLDATENTRQQSGPANTPDQPHHRPLRRATPAASSHRTPRGPQ